MDICSEIKHFFIYIGFQLFDLYIDINIWIHKQDFLKYIFPIKIKYIEPSISPWISICSLYKNRSIYEISITYLDDFHSIEKEYQYYCNKKDHFYRTENMELKEHLFIAKKENQYFSRSGGSATQISNLLKSNVVFVYIEYSHYKMSYTIELIIPEGMWIIGNELFSPTFVLRLLQHQSKTYFFDLDYKLNIIDHNIRNIELSYNNSILLDKDTYSIHSI